MSMKEWDNLIDKELLISLVEERPVLWDKTLDKYKDKTASTAGWREICVILNQNFEVMEQKQRQEFGKFVTKKWRQIRDAWVRTLKDKKNCKSSGSAASKTKLYKYHHQMLFLKNIIEPGETHESASAEKTDTHESASAEKTDTHESASAEKTDTTAVNENHKTNEDDSDEIEHLRNDNQTKSSPTKRRAPKKKFNELDAKMMTYIDHQIKPKKLEPDDRNLSFFKGVLPSLIVLNDDEILEFQSGVIKLLQDIKRRKVNQPNSNCLAPYTQASGAGNHQTQGYFTQASGASNHQTQGYFTQASGASNHQTQGYFTQASGANSNQITILQDQIVMYSDNTPSPSVQSPYSDENTLDMSVF
ncbi:uncharacterized protein LOC133523832 [Cydia pomonella]|uniref:uncharacterized protein LOC133523832 n=1 Tax=Cydia pomonella TaxID=82600 RepID=UPI002ADE06DF|nr:uncharacterized protein LOC133523832 [Cydia pomonella]